MPWVVFLSPQVDATLVAIICCLALLLVYLASTQMFKALIQGIFSWIPFVGGNLADAAVSIIDSITSAARPWLDQAAAPFISLLNTVAQIIVAVPAMVAGLLEFMVEQLAILSARITAEVAKLSASVVRALDQTAKTLALVAALVPTVEALQGAVGNIVNRLIPGAIAEAEQVANVQIELLRTETNGAIAAATAVFSWELGQAIDGFDNGLATLENGLTTAIDADMASVNAWLGQLDDLVGGVNVPALALEVVTITATIETIMVRCVNPVCGFWGPSMGLLTLLQDAATLGLLVALLAQARSDPDGMGAAVGGVAQDVYNMGRSIVSPVLGG